MAKVATLPTMPEALDSLADTASFGSDEQLAIAGRALMAKHARKLYDHLPGALSGEEPHDVHQARVATRRLRASLQSTDSAYRQKPVKQLSKQLRRLARVLGEVRDRDVLLMRIRNDIEQLPEPEHAPLLTAIEQMQHERDQAHAELIAELQHKRTAALLQNLNDFLLCPLEEVQAGADELPLLVRHYAGSAIWQHYEEVRHFETVMPGASATQLHELRIACKHLRYTLELFEPALPKDAKEMIKRVTAMQEHLGDLHDTDVAIDYFANNPVLKDVKRSTEPSANGQSADQSPLAHYITQRQQERQSLLAGVDRLWDDLTLVTPRRKLARLIAEL